MKKASLSFILVYFIIIALISLAGCDYQGLSVKEEYELQERCGKTCEEYFLSHYDGKGFYTNHYNKKMNKCFMLINTIDDSYWLKDIHEKRNYGFYFYTGKDLTCEVFGIKCKSKSDWDLLVKSYMEE